MEILRFEEAPSGAPKRKKSSRSFLALGLVATLFGISTAFASTTIQINNAKPISLGQGVNTFTACDTAIGLDPVTSLKNDLTSFSFDKLVVGYDYQDGYSAGHNPPHQDYTVDTTSPDAAGNGCGGLDFKVKFYKDNATPLDCNTLLGITVDTTHINFADNGAIGQWLGTGTGGERILNVTNTDNVNFKCQDSTIFYRVTRSTQNIEFLKGPSPDFFDHVTIETTSGVEYSRLT
jgi:hypothetical protein